ncbi:MAG: DUF971 domain-containing protein [Bacteroidota bacterium]|nr:DUF971 domain-containing protein [Bacteroidota bacterium]
MHPRSIKRSGTDGLTITWDDGHVSPLTFHLLRDECPCAECKGETVLLHTYKPQTRVQLPGHYELKSLQQVGSYAVQITWGDGHATGLYSWEYLRKLGESDGKK